MSKKELEAEVAEYVQLAKENKNIDVAALLVNALQKQDVDRVSSRAKKWAYLLSITFPPVGILFALRYFMGEESDAKEVAYWCLGLTAVAILSFLILGKVLLSGSGTSLDQINSITVNQIQELNP